MYCNVCNKYIKFKKKKKKKSYIFKKTFSLSIAYKKCGHEYKNIFKEKESIKMWKIHGLTNNIKGYQKYIIIPEENMNQDLRK